MDGHAPAQPPRGDGDGLAWAEPTELPRLAPGEAHVWRAARADAPERAARLERWLLPDELARAARFRRPADRARFLTGRGVLRVLLEHYGEHPDAALRHDCRLCGGAHGKPRLAAAGGGDLRFSVSHSGDLVLLAFARALEVGVDVEAIRDDVAWSEIAPSVLTSSELAEVDETAAPARARLCFRLWTRKEALAKVHGEGLALALAGVDVRGRRPRTSTDVRGRRPRGEARAAVIEDLPLDAVHAGALAIEGDGARVARFSWPEAKEARCRPPEGQGPGRVASGG